jgi:O-antigen/teichoic acid export membrane protein
MSKRPSLKINAISNWASLFIQVAVGFFLTPFIIFHLGQSGYGIWVLVGSFVGYYGLLNLGVGSAITRYIARFSAQNDIKSLNEIANTALAMFCTTGALAIFLSFLIAEPIANFFHIAPEHLAEFKRIVIVLGIATGLSFPSGVFAAIITARERFVAVNIINIFVTLLRTGATVVILLAGHGLAGIAYPSLAATIISLVAFFYIAKIEVPEFKIHTTGASLVTLKMLLVYGGYATIIAIADILRLKIDSLVIGKMIGVAEVGIYGVAALLINQMLNLITSGMSVLGPRFASLDGADKKEELKSTLLSALSISSFLACGIALVLVLFGRPFIFLWVGKDFAAAVPVLTILTVAYAFALSQTPGISLMYALNKHQYYAVATMLEAIANVLLSIFLARRYGMVGVALGTAIPMIVVKVFIQPVYVSYLIGFGIGAYGKAVAPAFFISAGIFWGHSFFISFINFDATEPASFFMLSFWGAVIAAIYLALICAVSPTILTVTRSILATGGTVVTRFLLAGGRV